MLPVESVCEAISIHALREESDLRMGVSGGDRLISIHALREESDRNPHSRCRIVRISIHALREESDERILIGSPDRAHFNPRSP